MEVTEVSNRRFVRVETPIAASSGPSLVFVDVVQDQAAGSEEEAADGTDEDAVAGDVARFVLRKVSP